MIISEETEELILSMYTEGASMLEIGARIDMNQHYVRRWLISQGLAIKAKDREDSYKAYNARAMDLICASSETVTTPKKIEPVDSIYRKLNVAERALIRTRDELNYYRGMTRRDERKLSLEDKVLEIVEGALGNITLPDVQVDTKFGKEGQPRDGLLMVMSDWHIGDQAKADVPDNTFNYEIAEQRVNRLIQETLNSPYQSDNLCIANLNDNFKGIIHGGIYQSEGSFIESLQQYVKLYTNMLSVFSTVYDKVTVYSTGDNHSRIHEKPVTHDKHLDYSRLMDSMVSMILNAKGLTNVEIITNDTGYHLVEINGSNIILFHGDTLRSYNVNSTVSRSKLQDTCVQVFNKPYRYAISGHTHEAHMKTNQYGGMNIVNGSLVGNTSYGVNSGYSAIVPSQLVLFVDDMGIISNINIVTF